MQRFIIFFILILVQPYAEARRDEAPASLASISNSPPSIGIFALPPPQQPGPLLSFGQNVIGRNKAQYTMDADFFHPTGQSYNGGVIYGFTDNLSLYFNVQTDSDPLAQFEYQYYQNGNASFQEQATIVGAVSLPVNQGEIGTNYYGSPGFFMGTTFNRANTEWMGFVSPGAFLTTSAQNLRLGSQYYYEAGIGKCFLSETNHYIVFGLIELDGVYVERDRFNGIKLNNTGGNIVLITPSLWYSNQNTIVQLGIAFPLNQSLNGNQKKEDYFFAASFSLTLS